MNDLKYEIKNNTLYILSCPEVFTRELLDSINPGCFYHKIVLGEGIKELDSGAFMDYPVREITLPSTLKKIGNYAFMGTFIRNIVIPDDVEEIGIAAFNRTNLTEIVLPSSLKRINKETFYSLKYLEKVIIPDGVEEIAEEAFANCINLSSISLPSTLKRFGEYAFRSCFSLDDVVIPDSIEELSEGLFFSCRALKNIVFPSKLKRINGSCFADCSALERIYLPDSVEEIGDYAFSVSSLNYVNIPTSLNKVHLYSFRFCPLRDVAFNDDGVEVRVDFNRKAMIENYDDKLFFHDSTNNTFGFYNNGKLINFKIDELIKKSNNKNIANELDVSGYIRLWYWVSKNKFIPHYTVVRNMPICDIDLFYINNNCNKWREIVEISNVSKDENRGSLFKVCYVLGLFQKNGKDSDKAKEFIINNVLNKMSEDEIHAKFDGMDLNNGYDKMYAEFFMKYFNASNDFMYDSSSGVDMLAASYNNFSNVRKVYPHKVVNTNRRSTILLPSHVMSAVSSKVYKNVNKGNLDFSLIVGKYAYSQSQFEKLQAWFNEGKNINKNDLKIFINKDINDPHNVTYNLLDKNNPLGAVVGNITNCCQVVGGAGESCVKYGMTMPNSKFMVFNFNKKIIGQAWVWYDEESRTVCLDNIEIPMNYISLIKNDDKLKESFLKCLKRMANNFIEEMEKHHLSVEKVTVGKGYNDISDMLDDNFVIDENCSKLKDYYNYSDAGIQYLIEENKKSR